MCLRRNAAPASLIMCLAAVTQVVRADTARPFAGWITAVKGAAYIQLRPATDAKPITLTASAARYRRLYDGDQLKAGADAQIEMLLCGQTAKLADLEARDGWRVVKVVSPTRSAAQDVLDRFTRIGGKQRGSDDLLEWAWYALALENLRNEAAGSTVRIRLRLVGLPTGGRDTRRTIVAVNAGAPAPGAVPTVAKGDRYEVQVSNEGDVDAYVAVLEEDFWGQVGIRHPTGNAEVSSTATIPKHSGWMGLTTMEIGEPLGDEVIIALAMTKPLDVRCLERISDAERKPESAKRAFEQRQDESMLGYLLRVSGGKGDTQGCDWNTSTVRVRVTEL